MNNVNKFHKASIHEIKIRSPDETRRERQDSVKRVFENEPGLYLRALHAIEKGNARDVKDMIDKVVGDDDMYVRTAIVDTIGPGFCHCDCDCEA